LVVENKLEPLRGVDLVFLCVPKASALDWVRQFLQAEVPCIDLTGVLEANEEVPLLAPENDLAASLISKPIVAAIKGVPLACYLALLPLDKKFALKRVVVTVLDSASGLGKSGADVLQEEVIGLFNRGEMDEPQIFSRNLAFDCIPKTEGTEGTAAVLSRMFPQVEFDVSCVQVPTFSGNTISLIAETSTAVNKEDATRALLESTALEIWEDDPIPSTRDSSGKDKVFVGGIRELSGDTLRVQFWISADALRLSATRAAALAELRYED